MDQSMQESGKTLSVCGFVMVPYDVLYSSLYNQESHFRNDVTLRNDLTAKGELEKTSKSSTVQ